MDEHGHIDSAVNLNSDVLENAILLEMTDTLKQLKKTYKAMRAMKQEERKKKTSTADWSNRAGSKKKLSVYGKQKGKPDEEEDI